MSGAKKVAYRIRLKCGNQRRSLLLVAPPIPRRLDVLTIGSSDWIVTSVRPEQILMQFQAEGAKLRQVFP